ncbi:MAG: hypothetical protein HQL67_02605 [Magnetococcales bacterium]|nr:hypothetical protein [Magnetococcales bacterium]
MQGDRILVEEHHRKAAVEIVNRLLGAIHKKPGGFAITVAGESGSGKSETAQAIVDELARQNISGITLGQDDYFVHPPKSNDRARRQDINWVGSGEVHLDLMSQHVHQILAGAKTIDKPLVLYQEDRIESETLDLQGVRVVVAEGTYTTLLDGIDAHVFIDRTFAQTKAHRQKRMRDASELDPFIDRVLEIEHRIISANRAKAHILIDSDYRVEDGPVLLGES